MGKKDKIVSSWDETEISVSSWEETEKGAAPESAAGSGGDSNAPQEPSLPSGASPEYQKELSKKNFVQRINNPTKFIQNPDGSKSTHKMASAEVDGKHIAFPTIVEKNGKLVELPINDAIDYALRNNEYAEFAKAEHAQWYADGGYKKGTPLEDFDKKTSESGLSLEEQRQAVVSHFDKLVQAGKTPTAATPNIGAEINALRQKDLEETKLAYEQGGTALPELAKKKEKEKENEKKRVEASLIETYMPKATMNVNEINARFKAGDQTALSDLDKANDEAVQNYLSYLYNSGNTEKQQELQSLWNELKDQKDKGEMNTERQRQYRNLVVEAQSKANAPMIQRIKDLKSKYDIDTFYAQAEVADTPEKLQALRQQTGVTEEIETLFRDAYNAVTDTGKTYDMVTKQFKELSDEEADNESAKMENMRQIKALENAPPATKAAYATKEALVGFGNTVVNLVGGILKAPRAFGTSEQGWTDDLAASIESLTSTLDGEMGRAEGELPSYISLPRILGEAAGSMAVMASGGMVTQSAGLGTGVGQIGTTYLMQLDENLQEGLDKGMTFNEARKNAQINSVASALVEQIAPEGFAARKGYQKLVGEGMSPIEAARTVTQDVAGGIGKEVFEEWTEQFTGDVLRTIEDERYETFDPQAYKEAAIGAILLKGGMSLFEGSNNHAPETEKFMMDAAENADGVIEKIEVADNKEAQTRLSEAKTDLDALKKHSKWDTLSEEDQAHAFALTQQIRSLEDEKKSIESIRIEDAEKDAKIAALQAEVNEIFNAPKEQAPAQEAATATATETAVDDGVTDGVIDGVTEGIAGETVTEEAQAEAPKVSNESKQFVDSFYKINEATDKATRREAAKQRREFLDANPRLKFIDSNIKKINKVLEAKGLLTKSQGCP